MRHPPRLFRNRILFFSLLWILVRVPAAFAGSGDAPALNARFSAGETLRGHRAAALHVDIDNPGPAFEGELRFQPRGGKVNRVVPVKVPGRSRRRFTIPFYPGAPGPIVGKLDLKDRGGTLLARAGPLQGTVSGMHCVLGVVGRRRDPRLKPLFARKELRAQNVMYSFEPIDLPELWEGLDPYDILIVWGVDFRSFSSVQKGALRDWVLRGGALVAVADHDYKVWGESFVARALDLDLGAPVTEDGNSHRLRWLADYSGDVNKPPDSFRRVAAVARAGKTVIPMHRGGFMDTLICKAPAGRGWVFFLAIDPSSPELRRWKRLPDLWRELLASWLVSSKWAADGEPHWTRAEELIAKGLKKRAAPLPSVLYVTLVILAYGLAIGPLEFLVWRLLKRPAWTVFSFPLIVIVASVWALWATRQIKGMELTQTEVTVEDIDPVSGDSVWDTYMGLYSPSPGIYALNPVSRGFSSEMAAEGYGFTGKRELPCSFGPGGSVRARLPGGGIRFFRAAGLKSRDRRPIDVRIKKLESRVEPPPGMMALGFWTDYHVEVRNGLAHSLLNCAVVAGPNYPHIRRKVLLLRGTIRPGESRTFRSETGDVEVRPLDRYLQYLEEWLSYRSLDPRTVFPYLTFFNLLPGQEWKWERKRRGLHRGDFLRHQKAAFFTGWIEDEPLHFSAKGWSPQAEVRLRWVRMRLAVEWVEFESH